MLQVHNISKRFGGFQALDGLTMYVPDGAIYGFIGKNGAGKTTLIKIVGGLLHADNGEITRGGGRGAGESVSAHPRLGMIAGAPAMYADMTAEENMKQQYRLLGLSTFDDIGEKLARVGLAHTGRKKARHFSLGMRQRMGLAMALSGDPDFVILDEPMGGLDPQGMHEFRELIRRLNAEQGVTFLISSHLLGELSRVATHFGFIDRGSMLKQLTAEELERSLQKSVRMRVSDADALTAILDGMAARYRRLSGMEVEVLSPVSITHVAVELMQKNCELYACTETEESLENYFMQLVGSEQHA